MHRCPTLVFSGTGLELMTRQATIRYLYHSANAAPEPLGAWLGSFTEPPYSPDPAPSDYQIFLTLQNLQSDKKLG
ncbi:hypothetical protein TNCV_3040941 [Trichonephila clavipes]|nr:hypothetical protein TNCV_3040941 [Trichonephila clavipes]